MDFLRSEHLCLVQIILSESSLRNFLLAIGTNDLLHFQDLNGDVPKHKRPHSSKIAYYESFEEKAQTLVSMINSEGFFISKGIEKKASKHGFSEVHEAIAYLSESYVRAVGLEKSINSLKTEYVGLCQTRDVHNSVSGFMKTPLDDGEVKDRDNDVTPSLKDSPTNFVCGLIEDSRSSVLERLLLRALRGNIVLHRFEIPVGDGKIQTTMCGFIIFFVGGETKSKVVSLCKALKCVVIDVQPNEYERNQCLSNILAKIDDVFTLLYEAQQARRVELSKIADVIETIIYFIKRERTICEVLDYFHKDSSLSKYYIAEAWVVTSRIVDLERISESIDTETQPVISLLNRALDKPPTKFPANEVFENFHFLTESYGIPSYREINPSVFMISTFPFLFGLMFGDVGHAFVLIVVAAILFYLSKKASNSLAPKSSETLQTVLSVRYLILLLGLHSLFAGFIYNDFFSRSIKFLPSAFKIENGTAVLKNFRYVYPLGIDPIWNISSNRLIMYNSYKMKQSIVVGVFHMLFGLSLQAVNQFSNGDFSGFGFQFIPKLLFFISTFGYLGFIILLKWLIPVDTSLITVFISMVLGFGKLPEDQPTLFFGQEMIQRCLVIIAFLSVPLMLFGEPLFKFFKEKRLREAGYNQVKEDKDATATNSLGDLLMHNMIHSIEFILGSVSNTASYLRLWALSLAHAQLSDVLWEMLLLNSVSKSYKLVIAFPFWALFTVGILICMEGMSAFLHALRLHWVEFNNKFFQGEGYSFKSFDLRAETLLKGVEV